MYFISPLAPTARDELTQVSLRLIVISTAAKWSGVEWRNLTPEWDKTHCGGRFLDSEFQ